jgi:uncharacterized membrane protein HdeD (DUF308 family)
MSLEISTSPAETSPRDALRAHSGWFIGLGIVWIVLGTLAVLVPFVATLAVELLFGAIFLIGGIAQVIHAFRARAWSGFLGQLLVGVLAIVLGIVLLLFPIQGALTLTIVLAAFFIAQGVLQLFYALRDASLPGRGWMIASGVLSIIVGGLIWLQLPGSAVWALGLLVGIQLIFTGWALVMTAMALRRGTPGGAMT